jgi:winged helix-turn-helix protein DUF2582
VWQVDKIGQSSGSAWNFLQSHGESRRRAVEKGVEASRAMVSTAVGGLAREEKIEIKNEKRAVWFSLREL